MLIAIHSLLVPLFAAFLLCFVVQAWHFLHHFRKAQSDTHNIQIKTGVSVIICARNEAENLLEHIPAICNQDYPNFEVLVVNDRSSDNSTAVLTELQKNHPILRVVNHKAEATGKKAALRYGIHQAKHDLLLFTDADCNPPSNQWISQMTGAFDQSTDIVLGFGAYEKQTGLLNQFVQYETYLTALQYFSWAAAGKPYMGVGRNLAYRKSAFLKTDQFEKTLSLASGDDDLMVQQIARADNTKLVFSESAKTISKAPRQVPDWWRQKKRHLSTGTAYPKAIQKRLSAFSASLVFFYLIGFAIMAISIATNSLALAFIVSSLFVLRWLTMIICNEVQSSALQLKEPSLCIPFYDVMFCLYLIVFAPFLFYKPNAHSWNKKWIDSYS